MRSGRGGFANPAPEFINMVMALRRAHRKVSAVAAQLPIEDDSILTPTAPTQKSEAVSMPPERLKGIRAELGLTQRQLAAVLGIKESRYGNWECGFSKIAPEFSEQITVLLSMAPSERKKIVREAGIGKTAGTRRRKKN